MATRNLNWGNARFVRTLENMAQRMGTGGTVRVGFLEGAAYPEDESGKSLSVATVAFWDEFGTKNSPPRPYFRRMVAKESPNWGRKLAAVARHANYNVKTTLTLMGEGIKDQLVTSINEFSDPPNAPSTIAKKGFDKPLIHTALMIRSVDYEVRL
jgi:hypothetical protein